jgi:hypothetical protein
VNLNEESAQTLEMVADKFETGEFAWYQGALHLRDANGHPVASCVLGAMALLERMTDHVINALQEHTGSRGLGGVGSWNDQPGRTLPEVIDTLKLAAKDLRNAVTSNTGMDGRDH